MNIWYFVVIIYSFFLWTCIWHFCAIDSIFKRKLGILHLNHNSQLLMRLNNIINRLWVNKGTAKVARCTNWKAQKCTWGCILIFNIISFKFRELWILFCLKWKKSWFSSRILSFDTQSFLFGVNCCVENLKQRNNHYFFAAIRVRIINT